MHKETYLTPEELQGVVGERLRRLRLNQNLDQAATAAKAGVSVRALRSLEAGRGSQLVTLLRVLKALDALDGLDSFAPRPTISPLALLEHAHQPRRASKPRRPRKSVDA